MFPVPPLFKIIQEQSGTSWQEMYKVFNMGHRFEIYTDAKSAERIIVLSAEAGLEAKIIGHCEASKTRKLTISSSKGTFIY
jgi:phosphoribosylformylglycinamidine cyclo-ligase